MKGSTIDSPSFEALDRYIQNPVNKVKPSRVAKRVGVTTIAMSKLELFKKSGQKHYNLLQIIADPLFLVACYEEIAKKKGNMTPGTDGYTIDGINWN
jgi:hypothetical protein